MQRRSLVQLAAAVPLGAACGALALPARAAAAARRTRPGDPDWPSEAQWQQFAAQLGGDALRPVHSPFAPCLEDPGAASCTQLFKALRNPYYIGDEVGLTQSLGWVDAWTSRPSVWAVAARSSADVAAAVDFARRHRLRLVVKGGGHSYQGTSNAADSLLIWTRRMNDVRLHETFVPEGCAAQAAPVRAVSVGAGALWSHVYDAVSTRGGGYVQGGGCLTVGVAGLVQSGGFGSFSKAWGLAAGSLLEAEVVTADGQLRIANACREPELFWGLKGGGGGSLGVVTRLTLKVHALPESFGAVNLVIKASSGPAYRRLLGMMVDFYAERLHNPHWGEQIRLRPDHQLRISMVFQGLDRAAARAVWQPFLDAVDAEPEAFAVEFSPLKIVATSARDFWAPTLFKRTLGFIASDDRPDALPGNVYWPGDQSQAGQTLHGYQSAWLPAALLAPASRPALCDALFAASRHWGVALHVNKGLAGAPPEAIAAARDSATNPAVLEAFALVICGAHGPPAHPGVAGHEPDAALARRQAAAIGRAMDALRQLVPQPGSYLAESNYFEPDWQRAFWGSNYPRLLAVKERYDPEGLFFVHHGVGSERWSADGFERIG